MAAHDSQLQDVRTSARTFAPDWYVSALLAPADQRSDLITLAAFFGETDRIVQTVSQDLLAEIRLQWWRDSLAEGAPASGHPVADAMLDLISRRGLDRAVIMAMLDRRSDEIPRLGFADEAAFDSYADAVDGGLLRLQATIRGVDVPFDELTSAARALARVRIALGLPYFAAHGRLPVWPLTPTTPVDDAEAAASTDALELQARLIEGARRFLRHAVAGSRGKSRRYIDALLPVALLEPYLRALEANGRDPLRDVAQIAPLTRVWRLAASHWRGRL